MSSFGRSLTRRGQIFMGMGGALLVSGLGLGMLDLTRVGGLLLALPLLAGLITHRHSLTFGVARRPIPTRVQIDQPATVELAIINPTRRRSPVIAAEETVDYVLGDRPRVLIPPLRRDESHTMTYEVRSQVRGRHTLGPLALSASDPFGLITRAVSLQSSTDLIVLPKVVPLGSQGTGARGVGSDGTIPHMVALHGEDDVSVRDYRDGDDLRRVHWPATARTGQLMVRQEDRPAMRRAVVLIDSRESVHGPTTSRTLEWAITMAASVVSHLDERGFATHLVTASPEPGIGHETTLLESSMEALAFVTPGPEEDLAGVLHLATAAVVGGGLIVALIGGCTDDDARAVAALRTQGGTGIAFVVADPAHDGSPDPRSLGTVELLRQAGWKATLVGPGTGWAGAWSATTSTHSAPRPSAGARS
ncbi:MAG: DUF58 domain-containing protein [Actinomycetia bacterium]|nr:DUF58 domain-containing protein [Actinomycetes bacterium]